MRRLLTGLLLAAALIGTATAAQPGRVLAVEWQAGGGKLRWVAPTTLRPVGPAVLNVGGAPANVVAVSPDRKLTAIGGGAKGRLRLVRLAGLRQQGLLWVGDTAVLGAIWRSSNRLVVLLSGAPPEVVVVNPVRREVLRREKLTGASMGAVRAGDRLLTLLAPLDPFGSTQLAVVGMDGSVRTIALPQVAAGVVPPARPGAAAAFASPALVADGSRAVVLGRESLVEVDLETLAVRAQRLDVRAPARATKYVEGWGRWAVWLRGNTVAYAGWSTDAARKRATTGVRIVDIATGSTRTLDAAATSVTRAGSTLLVHGAGPLRGFGLDGELRFELLHGVDTGYVQVAGRYAYVGSRNSTRFTVVDVPAGKVVGQVRTAKPTVVLQP